MGGQLGRLFLLPDLWLNPSESALTMALKFCPILVQISPLDSALTKGLAVSPLDCAVVENRGEGSGPRARNSNAGKGAGVTK